jgi:hypothetical protein
MKDIFFLLSIFFGGCAVLLSTSCVEPEGFTFDAIVENNSSENIKVIVYRSTITGFSPIDSVNIISNTEASVCSYYESFYAGFGCEIGAFKYVFDNGKGYFCERGANRNNVSEICFFNDKNPFSSSQRLPNNGNGVLFTITQEDFENARELP